MDEEDGGQPSTRSQRGLDWLNFFIADVQTGFGPFVALYLASRNWTQSQIGLLLTVGGIAAIASQVPGGALVDWVASKRLLIGGALALIAAGALIFAYFPDPAMVFAAEVLHGSTGGVIKPALAAVGLGLVGHKALSGRLGRNHRYDAFGNALTAALIGLLAHLTAQQTTFLVAAALCLPAGYALTRIRGTEIDYARARSAGDREKPHDAARLHDLLRNRSLLVFVGSLVMFQLANASVMPLASERLGQQHEHESELVTAALVVVPQVVTGLIAAWVARRADAWGRKPLLLIGYGVLPIRAVLFALAPGPWYLVAIQALGGLTAAVIGIMTPLVIADVTRGTGRYNLAQGAAGTAAGIGASLSTTGSGYLAQLFGYAVGFAALAAIGLVGLAGLYWLLPETRATGGRVSSAR
jgi:MFS family permease